MSDIVLQNICKKYNTENIIDRFSYVFTCGEKYCIMGSSGIGKTTLLRIITGLEKPDSGIIRADDTFSAVFQEDRLIDELTPVVNVKIVLKNVKDKVIADELKKVLPDNSIYKKCSELSGGMKRRVAIVRAVMADSACIVMDEPFTGLDDNSKIKVINYILNNLRGRTLICVTHDKHDADILSAKVCQAGSLISY